MRCFIICCTLLLASCASDFRMDKGAEERPLLNTEGYLSFVINTLDPLKDIQLLNTQSDEDFYIGRAPEGVSQITLRLPEGEYCFIGFDVYSLRVDFVEGGFCTYIEANEVNYFGEFLIRDPVTTLTDNYPRFLRLLNQVHPEICRELINKDCAI